MHVLHPLNIIKKRPLNTSITSFNGTLNLLNIAKNNNAKLLFASSSEVYGNPEKHPQKKTILAMLTLLVKGHVMKREKEFQRLFVMIFIENIKLIYALQEFSIHTDMDGPR